MVSIYNFLKRSGFWGPKVGFAGFFRELKFQSRTLTLLTLNQKYPKHIGVAASGLTSMAAAKLKTAVGGKRSTIPRTWAERRVAGTEEGRKHRSHRLLPRSGSRTST